MLSSLPMFFLAKLDIQVIIKVYVKSGATYVVLCKLTYQSILFVISNVIYTCFFTILNTETIKTN